MAILLGFSSVLWDESNISKCGFQLGNIEYRSNLYLLYRRKMRKEAHRKYEEGNLERCQILHTYCQKVVRALWGLVGNTKEKRYLKQQTTTNVPNFSQI